MNRNLLLIAGSIFLAGEMMAQKKFRFSPTKPKEMLKDIIVNTETDVNWETIRLNLDNYKAIIPNAYLARKDYINFKMSIAELGIDE